MPSPEQKPVQLTKKQILQLWDAIADQLLIETNQQTIRNLQAIKVLIYNDVMMLSKAEEAIYAQLPDKPFKYPFQKINQPVQTAPHLIETMQLICNNVEIIPSRIFTEMIWELRCEEEDPETESVQAT